MVTAPTRRPKVDGLRMTIKDWCEKHRDECDEREVRCVFKGVGGYYVARLKSIFLDNGSGLTEPGYRISVANNSFSHNWWEDGYRGVTLSEFRFAERVTILWCADGERAALFIGGELVDEILYHQQGR